MSLHRAMHRWSWIALWAVFGLVFAPTVSAALSAAGGAGWVEVCSAQGPRIVAADADAQPTPSQAAAGVWNHCPLCGTVSGVLPLVALDAADWLLAPLPEQAPRSVAPSRGVHPEPRAPAQPRAPPVLS